MRLKLLAVALAAALSPSIAHAAWLEASSEHFVIYANDTQRDITRFAEQLERYHAGMALVLSSTADAPSPSNRITVYVVRNKREVRVIHGGDNKYLAGFYVPNAGGSVAIVPAIESGSGAITLSMVTLLHEYAHHFLISSNPTAQPRWLSEGAAEFFASSRFESDGSIWLGRPAQHRAGELFNARDVKAAELLDPAEYKKNKKEGYDAFYGKSWLLYHYLTFDEARKGQLRRYIQALESGTGQREAAGEAFGDFDQLEKDLDRYLDRSKVSALRLQSDLLRIAPVQVRTVSDGEAAIIPVRIRSKRGVDSETAGPLLDDARAVAAKYPDDPAVLAALAECEFDAGNDKEAIAAADAALKIDGRRVNAYIQKGYALFRMARTASDPEAAYKAARAPFVALNHLETDHPIPLIYYFRSFAERRVKPTDLAVSGLIHAMQVAPFDMSLRMNLGLTLLAEGHSEEARVVLEPVAYNPHGGGMGQKALEVIRRIEADPKWKGHGAEMTSP